MSGGLHNKTRHPLPVWYNEKGWRSMVTQFQKVLPCRRRRRSRPERSVSIPREALIVALFNVYASQFSGWRTLDSLYPGRIQVSSRASSEERIVSLLAALNNEDLVALFCTHQRPTVSYLEASGVQEDDALRIHLGEAGSNELRSLAERGIIPADFVNWAPAWWPSAKSATG